MAGAAALAVVVVVAATAEEPPFDRVASIDFISAGTFSPFLLFFLFDVVVQTCLCASMNRKLM